MVKKLMICFTLIFIFTLSAGAVNNSNYEGYGGINYNYYKLDYANEVMKSITVEEENTGLGFFFGLRKWYNPNKAFGLELEHMAVKWESNLEANTTGLLGTFTTVIPNEEDLELKAIIGLGAYRASYKASEGSIENTDDNTCLGGKLALEISKEVEENTNLFARIGYRHVLIPVGIDELDFSGLELSGGFNFYF